MRQTKPVVLIPAVLTFLALGFSSLDVSSAADWPASQIKIIPVHMGENIQAVINQAKPGSIILVSPGTYYGAVQLKNGITLRSEAGAQKTVLDGQGRGQAVVVGADGCTLEGFTITGQGKPEDAKTQGHAVECINTSPALKNNYIANNYGTGILISGKQAKPEIIGNKVYSNGKAGVACDENSQPVVVKNECYNNAWAGIGVRNGSNPRIEDNLVHDNKMAGIGVMKDCAPVIKGNYVHGNQLSGIGVEGGKPELTGNHLYNNGRCGIGVKAGAVVTAAANTITGNTLSGIGVQGGAKVVLRDNVITENVMAGVTLTDDSIGSLMNNKVTKNGTEGIVCSATKATIKNNVISGNTHHGIGVHRFSTVEVAGNEFIGNGANDRRGSGVLVVSSDDANIHHNNFENNYGPGVYSHHCSPVIEHNTFTNDLIFGKDHASPLIAYNTFYNTGKSGGKKVKAGIDLREQCNPIIKNNEFYGKFAISVRYNCRPYIAGNTFSGSHQDSISSGRSGIKVDNSTPTIKENVFYNGNKILVKGKSYRENIDLLYTVRKVQTLPANMKKDPKIKPEEVIVIANNLFLD